MFKPHKWVAFTVLAWGAISTCQAATTNWAGLMVCRVGLGIVEAMYGPGVPLYLSFFYPREKIGLRTGIFLSGSALANAYGGALAYGIAQAKGAIAPWKILFLVEGLPTCAIAVVAWFYIPDSPQTAKFLNPRQKEIAVELSLRQPGDRETTGLQWKQVLGSLLDYRSKQDLSCLAEYHTDRICRLSPRNRILRVQRVLRIPPAVRAHHYKRHGSFHQHSVQRLVSASLPPVLDDDSRHLIPVGSRKTSWPLCRYLRFHCRYWLHLARHADHRGSPVLRPLPQCTDLRQCLLASDLGGQLARHGFKTRRCIVDSCDLRAVRTSPGHERLPEVRRTLLPEGHVGLLRSLLHHLRLRLCPDADPLEGQQGA